MANALQLIGGSVPKGLESHTKERKVIRITDIARKENSMTDKEKIAKSAASTWCRCFKCDGIVNSTHEKCEKDKLLTCHKWYDGYRTALLAISDYEQQLMAKAVKVKISNASIVSLPSYCNLKVGDKVLIIKEE